MLKKIAIYILFVLLFILGKFLFMTYYSDIFGVYSKVEWMQALWSGLPHDLSSAGYLMALPFVVQLAFVWIKGPWHGAFMRFWLRLSLFLMLDDYLSDLFLYGFWGFRIDSTAMSYFFDNPVEAIGQAPLWMLIVGLLLLAALWWVLQRIFCRFYPERIPGSELRLPTRRSQIWQSVTTVLCCGLLFVAIRGGVTPATMNVGRVYFSSEMPLNHAATNPFFSLIYSMSHKKTDFSKQYRFMSAEEAAEAYAEMNAGSCGENQMSVDSLTNVETEVWQDSLMSNGDSVFNVKDSVWVSATSLLKTDRPNIVLLILEGFSGAACMGIRPEADSSVMPNVNRMYRDGIGFSNFFANSFRTDRGTAAILASYPGQPTYSIMKDQARCNNLQYMTKRLKGEGYNLHFIHGGDVNFTNMRGFLISGGFENITGDVDFPISERLSKWGVPDHLMFDYLYDEIAQETTTPYMKVLLTLSSHEPFDVPYLHFDDKYTNSLAYADSCIGAFVDRVKSTPAWDNLLIIGVADHSYSKYPEQLQNHEILRYRIPMFWTGGAISAPRIVETYGSQTDITATLFRQMGLSHEEFNFSKDLMDSTIGHYGFYAFSDGFGLVTDSCRYVQDNARPGQGLSGTDDPNGRAEKWGKAYLQTLYDDLNKR